jgi:hypothetical protein
MSYVVAGRGRNVKENLSRVRLAMVSVVGGLLVATSSSCGPSSNQATGGSPTPTVAVSPTPDAATLNYVALIKTYWIQVQTADEATSTTNVAARVCLGMASQQANENGQLVDPAQCRARMLASLPVHEGFLKALQTTPAPPQFSADDQAFRTQLPLGIADLKKLIAITATGNVKNILLAATTYVDDFIPIVTSALDDVDPSVVHV